MKKEIKVKHVADMVDSEHHKYLKSHKPGMKQGHNSLEKIPADKVACGSNKKYSKDMDGDE